MWKIFSTSLEVRAVHYHAKYYVPEYRIQKLMKSFYLVGVPMYEWEVDRETVPPAVWKGRGTNNYEGADWRSKFRKWIKKPVKI